MIRISTRKERKHLDKIGGVIASSGISGLVLLVAMGVSGWVGAAAITTGLASLGGPLGMLGGIALLGVLTLVSRGMAKFGFETLFKAVLTKLKEQGHTNEEIVSKIQNYPLSKELKLKLMEFINLWGEQPAGN